MKLKTSTVDGKAKPSGLFQTPKLDKTNNIAKQKFTSLSPRDQRLDQPQLPLTQRTAAASAPKYSVQKLIANLKKAQVREKNSPTREQVYRIRTEQWTIMKKIKGELNNATEKDLTVLIKILPLLLNSHSPTIRYQAALMINQISICCPTIPFPKTEIMASINKYREALNTASNVLSPQKRSDMSRTLGVLSDAMNRYSLEVSPRTVEASAAVDTSVASDTMKDTY